MNFATPTRSHVGRKYYHKCLIFNKPVSYITIWVHNADIRTAAYKLQHIAMMKQTADTQNAERIIDNYDTLCDGIFENIYTMRLGNK